MTWAWIEHVQCRDRLVEQHQARVHRQRSRHADALALAARELVREAGGRARGSGRRGEQLARARRSRPRPAHPSGRADDLPTRLRGFSGRCGSWKTICTCGASRAGRALAS
jgi:hypothetical protein